MAVCPCCGKSLPEPAQADELCPECSRALETGIDDSPPEVGRPQQAVEVVDKSSVPRDAAREDSHSSTRFPPKRPIGITIMAAQCLLSALPGLLFAIVLIAGAHATAAVLNVLQHPGEPWEASSFTLRGRVELALLCLLSAWLGYLLASGLWRLKNWARRIAIAICLLDVAFGSTPLFFWPLFELLPTSPVFGFLGRVLSFVLVCYLFNSSVKTAFGVPNPHPSWFYATAGLALVSLGFTLYKSEPELRAIQWHLRHGDQIEVNGVTFPVYKWYAPVQACGGASFHVDDWPGPLRSKDRFTAFSVEGCRSDNQNLTVTELVDKEFASYQNAGYKDLRKFKMQVRGEPLECMESADFGSHAIYCYGDGAIGHIFFVGGEESLARFNRMLAEAR